MIFEKKKKNEKMNKSFTILQFIPRLMHKLEQRLSP